MRLPMILSAAALALAACGAPAETPEAEAEPSAVAETASAETPEPPPATGFLTFNPPPPPDAIDKKNDGIKRDADGRPYNYALLGQKLPAFTAPISTGGTFNSADIDKWTVIDVWGVWCGDCVADGPYVAALERAIAQDPDLDFVSLHTPASPARTSPEELFKKYGSLEAYFESAGYSFPVVLDNDASIRTALQITWTPSYLLVSPDGVVRGFRSDLSVANGEPVKDFIRDIARVRGEVRAGTYLRIGPQGTGGLSGTTPFTLQALEAAFPGLTVETALQGPEPAVAYLIRGGETQDILMTVEADWSRGYVGRAMVTGAKVKGPLGETVGTSTLAALPENLREACEAPADDGRVTCPETGTSGTFLRTYAPGAGGSLASDPVLIRLEYLPPVPSP